MENITIKQLRYFEAVSSLGHFGQAADQCAISQPAISVQIKELEQSLGQKLFERQARHIRLTTFGEIFSERVQPILRAMDDLSDLARASKAGQIGKLKLGVIPTVGPYLLPRIVSELNGTYPNLDLRIRETQTEKLVSDLLAGELDIALLALPISEPALTEVQLFEEPFVFLRPLEDAKKPVPNAETLRKMRLLLLEEGHCFRDQALSFCTPASNPPRESMEGSSLSTLVQMVGSGLGVTLLPQMAVALETRSADVSIAYFPEPQPTRRIGIIWRKSSPLSEQFLSLADLFRRAISVDV